MPAISHIERLLQHVQRSGVVRARELETLGIPRVALQRAVDRGQVVRRARGIYVRPDHATTRHTDVAAVAARSPKAIVCLVTALEYEDSPVNGTFATVVRSVSCMWAQAGC